MLACRQAIPCGSFTHLPFQAFSTAGIGVMLYRTLPLFPGGRLKVLDLIVIGAELGYYSQSFQNKL